MGPTIVRKSEPIVKCSKCGSSFGRAADAASGICPFCDWEWVEDEFGQFPKGEPRPTKPSEIPTEPNDSGAQFVIFEAKRLDDLIQKIESQTKILKKIHDLLKEEVKTKGIQIRVKRSDEQCR